MRLLQRNKGPASSEIQEAPPTYLDARKLFASNFLVGEGLEIGALHEPLAAPPQARVRYVDRMTVEELRSEYPELAGLDLTPVDIVDDGEQLTSVRDGSQDFIIANHFLEHCEDPIGTIGVHLRKLRPGGILFYAVPDKRYTFDHRREPTPLDHMVADHEQGAERSRDQHYEEWARWVSESQPPEIAAKGPPPDDWVKQQAEALRAAQYSIHMHVWTQAEFLNLILHCRQRFDEGFDIEAASRRALEFVVVLRKAGAAPEPASASSADVPSQPHVAELEADNELLREQVAGMSSSASWRLTAPLRAAKQRLRRRRSRQG